MQAIKGWRGVAIIIAVISIAGCAANPTKQLERVAKDWALTIRASQVIPIYPLSEDVQPGDVFLVSTPISKQTEIYEAKGFLPLDQLVTRLDSLDYERFYRKSYWAGTYAANDHERPGWGTTGTPVKAPRAAFPSYTFTVRKGSGLQLAIPIQGVPVGLGLMGASAAIGSVTLKDAYTYGIDGQAIASALYRWYRLDPDIQTVLSNMAKQTDAEIYLRAVNRVYLTGGVVVQLTNQDTTSVGVDVGAPKGVKIPDLSDKSPAQAKVAVENYKAALEALSKPMNDLQNNLPGGSFRFVEANQRGVTLAETFDRPLVIGYAGFDVRVFKNGRLSAPIPSFAVLSGAVNPGTFVVGRGEWNEANTKLAGAYLRWLRQQGNEKQVKDWLAEIRRTEIDVTSLVDSMHNDLLLRANNKFKFHSP